ncbi:HAD-IA family hydrolase [Rhodopirellula sp. JC740]|uniref:HAD-IA family hydrolase n=1 Tax=Rhodopirellula halodulae TaxID=2894198 RepID=A0ABS8NHV6_9BACT|nr:HAD-IA family hydrolase [Rhodopirellula sp. JC740]MCC9643144.1 HAD-IA family hydrolase [Rhodopirellula sp. JC740]
MSTTETDVTSQNAPDESGQRQLNFVIASDLSEHYEGLIFDCDGTLTNSMPLHYLAWHETMTRHGIEFPEDRFYAMGGMPSEKIIAVLSSEQGVTIDIDLATAEKEAAFIARIPQVERLSHVTEIAERHRERVPMSVASGGMRDIVADQLRAIGVSDWFSALVGSEDTELHKPEPDVFLCAAERMGVDPTRCLVFEDSPLGFEAARKAGMHWVDVRLNA